MAEHAWNKLGIIAGGGDLPVRLAEHCRGQGKPYFVARIAPLASPELSDHPGADNPLDKMGARFAALRAAGCDAVVLAGAVRRPDFNAFDPDERTRQMLPAILAAAALGDDQLLRALIAECETDGFTVVGAEDVLGGLLAPLGALGAHKPDTAAMADIRRAAALVAALGAFDVGQGAVVCAGLALAVEAQEGTDAMLARVAGLPRALRGASDARRGVLVKRPKPAQERRVDLPVIGLTTIENAAAAGLAGVAIEAQGALIVDREAVVARADALGLFVLGFDPDNP
ncbi:MAG TPA: UDP-2,3-diacylglucosamine diphosphatase LpxI [Caulobacterales bacterium]|nr:UDP-2,3-diacylglucosamine diphosphatase LpxI [Caulobacterales bacterium]